MTLSIGVPFSDIALEWGGEGASAGWNAGEKVTLDLWQKSILLVR